MPYYHLINSKFIAGSYYKAGEKNHQIIFSKCGSIEGAKYISTVLDGCIHYVAGGSLFLRSDALEFYKSDTSNTGVGCYWETKHDSLILRYNEFDNHNCVVLLKAH